MQGMTISMGWLKRTNISRVFRFRNGGTHRIKQTIQDSGAFDREFYSRNNPDVAATAIDPLDHYVLHGWKEGRKPNRWFDPHAYLGLHPDVEAAGVEPLYHYLVAGKDEGRTVQSEPEPNLDQAESSSPVSLKETRNRLDRGKAFDAATYLAENPDVYEAGIDPLDHYVLYGWKEGRKPNAWFDPLEYLRLHPDVEAAGIEPFYHYLVTGKSEGRSIHGEQKPNSAEPELSSPISIEETRRLFDDENAFDAETYLTENPDIGEAGIDPLEHYLATGWKEGRAPNHWFSPSFYLKSNPDVAAAGIEPLSHFLLRGRSEGRLSHRPLEEEMRILERLKPLELRYADYPETACGDIAVSRGARNIIEPMLEFREAVVVLSHDNYRRITGGVQSCIGDDETAFNATERDFIHCYPANPKPGLVAGKATEFFVAVNVNGREAGVFGGPALLRALASIYESSRTNRAVERVILHHVMGFNLDWVSRLIAKVGDNKALFWIHDYFSICPQYTLLRNDVSFCGAPAPDSNSCSICAYGSRRREHIEKFQAIFAAHEIDAVAPSKFALEFWKSKNSGFRVHKSFYAPHCEFMVDAGASRPALDMAKPLRVGFMGYPSFSKGWQTWKTVVRAYRDDPRYEFFHLGKNHVRGLPCKPIEVSVTAECRDAMVEALKEHEIDVVILCAAWPETFSFTYHEALAAGCFVITNQVSGNIERQVAENETGLIVQTLDDLLALFSDSSLSDAVAQKRKQIVPTGSLLIHSVSVRKGG